MHRKRDGLVPVAEVLSDLNGPVAAIPWPRSLSILSPYRRVDGAISPLSGGGLPGSPLSCRDGLVWRTKKRPGGKHSPPGLPASLGLFLKDLCDGAFCGFFPCGV